MDGRYIAGFHMAVEIYKMTRDAHPRAGRNEVDRLYRDAIHEVLSAITRKESEAQLRRLGVLPHFSAE